MEDDDDDDEVLAWKALEEHDDAHAAAEHHQQQQHNHLHHHHVVSHAHGGGISTGTDDDVEDFAELAYAHHARLTAAAAAMTHPPHSLLQLQHEHEDQHEHDAQQQLSRHDHQVHRHQQQNQHNQRFKRKNFSKQLQLICLQRYAQSAKEHGKLPDKTECQLLLHQSYLQFLKDGGAPDEPRLSHQEFLKLIRNRRREMYVRAQKLKFPHNPSSSSASKTSGSTNTAASSNAETAGDAQPPLSAAKRKLQQEHARIYELIEIIDQAREQSGLASDQQQQQNQSARPLQRNGKRRLSNKSASPLLSQQTISHEHQQQMAVDPNAQIHAIFRIQQETLEIQREIAERLKVISLHRSLRQHDPMEPSSASV
ncbi:hypothetical protein Gpo141_00000007 [Globisporangium polare]